MDVQHWHHVNNPLTIWEKMPYLLVAEVAVYSGTLLTFIHAATESRRTNSPSNINKWFSTFLMGIFTDSIFAVLPIADNFWHAQATFMINSRVPLFVPCLYIFMLYVPHIVMENAKFSTLGRISFGGLMAAFVLHPYDNLSSTFLFTTWHDTDPLVAVRLHGNPVGNLLFCFIYGASFHFWFNCLHDGLRTSRCLISGLLSIPSVLIITPIIQFTAWNFTGTPKLSDLAVTFFLLFSLAFFTVWSSHRRFSTSFPPLLLFIALLIYQSTFLYIATFGEPKRQVSTGYHQELGPCNFTIIDRLSGRNTTPYLCATNYSESYRFDCPSSMTVTLSPTWYTICGSPNTHHAQHVISTATALLLAAGWQILLSVMRLTHKENKRD